MTAPNETRMTPEELIKITRILTKMQGREFDDEDKDLWFDLLSDLHGPVAIDATKRLLRDNGRFITPAMIREQVTALSAERLRAAEGKIEPPSGLTSEEYRTWLRTHRMAVVRGESLENAAALAASAIGREARMIPAGSSAPPEVALRRLNADATPAEEAPTLEGEIVAQQWPSDTGPYLP